QGQTILSWATATTSQTGMGNGLIQGANFGMHDLTITAGTSFTGIGIMRVSGTTPAEIKDVTVALNLPSGTSGYGMRIRNNNTRIIDCNVTGAGFGVWADGGSAY